MHRPPIPRLAFSEAASSPSHHSSAASSSGTSFGIQGTKAAFSKHQTPLSPNRTQNHHAELVSNTSVSSHPESLFHSRANSRQNPTQSSSIQTAAAASGAAFTTAKLLSPKRTATQQYSNATDDPFAYHEREYDESQYSQPVSSSNRSNSRGPLSPSSKNAYHHAENLLNDHSDDDGARYSDEDTDKGVDAFSRAISSPSSSSRALPLRRDRVDDDDVAAGEVADEDDHEAFHVEDAQVEEVEMEDGGEAVDNKRMKADPFGILTDRSTASRTSSAASSSRKKGASSSSSANASNAAARRRVSARVPSAEEQLAAVNSNSNSTTTTARTGVSNTTQSSSSSNAPTGPRKSSSVPLRQWQTMALQLAQRSELLEKELLHWFQTKKTLWFTPNSPEDHLVTELDRMSYDASVGLKKMKEELRRNINHIKHLVKRFKTHMNNKVDTEFFVDQLRTIMEEVENELGKFKLDAKKQYVALNSTQRELEKECEEKMKLFEGWVQEEAQATGSSSSSAAAERGSGTPLKKKFSNAAGVSDGMDFANLPEDASSSSAAAPSLEQRELKSSMARIEAAIEADGGATGGWDSRDHAAFLRILTQTPSSAEAQLIARISKEILNQTPASALLHVEWYERYKGHLEQKKQLLAAWKESKKTRDQDEVDRELEEALEREKEEKKLLWEAREKERVEKAAAVAEWKSKKAAVEEAKRFRSEKAKEDKEKAAREKAEDERRRLRSMVEAYQEEKAVHAMVEQMQAAPTNREISEKEKMEKENRRKLKEKQEETLRTVREKREAKQREAQRLEDRKAALARASVSVAALHTTRDPSRLTAPTSAMVERAKIREEEEAALAEYQRTHGGRTPSTMLGRVSLGHTATPSWRKGI